jgi:hypothetical protein
MREGDLYPIGVGYFGVGEGLPMKLPSDIKRDLKPYHKPQFQSFQYLHSVLPDVQHISSYPTHILVKLYEMEESEFLDKVNTLPCSFGQLSANYHNGTFIRQTFAEVKKPDFAYDVEGDYEIDDTDYLAPENGEALRPGYLMQCIGNVKDDILTGECSSTSGIAVKRGDQLRLTVASHTWEAVRDKKVYHRGHYVGNVDAVVGEDIGLVTPHVPVLNHFLSYDIYAKRLITVNDLTEYDKIIVDSCYTGPLKLQCAGLRDGKSRRRDPVPTGDYTEIVIEQGILAINTPFIPNPPQISREMCGTPLLRFENNRNPNVQPNKGEICGFFLGTDLVGHYRPMLYAYCQCTDALVEDGWSVAATEG